MRYIQIIMFLSLPKKHRTTNLLDLRVNLLTYKKGEFLQIIEDQALEIYINFPITSRFSWGPFPEWNWVKKAWS